MTTRSGAHLVRLLATITLFAVVAAACGDDGDSATDSGPTAAVDAPKVGVVIHFTAADYFKRFTVGAQDGASDAGGSVEVIGTPQPDPPAQLRMFTDLATDIEDGIAVVASPPDLWVRPLEDVASSGVPLLATVEPPANGSTTLTTFVGDNGFQTGATLAASIAGMVDDPDVSGTIVIGTGDPAIQTFVDRVAGMRSVFDTQLPNAEIVVATVGFEPTNNLSTWENLFATHGDDAIAFVADGEHSGANLAIVSRDNPGDFAVGLVDMDVATAEGIRDGHIDVAIGGVPYLRGYLTGRLLAQAARDGVAIPDGWLDMCCEVITAANAAEAIERLEDDDAMRAYYAPIMEAQFADLEAMPFKPLAEVYEQLAPSADPNPWLGPSAS